MQKLKKYFHNITFYFLRCAVFLRRVWTNQIVYANTKLNVYIIHNYYIVYIIIILYTLNESWTRIQWKHSIVKFNF